jgi:hypothetical protein
MQYRKKDNDSLRYGFPLQLTPEVVALARTVDASISGSTEITLNEATTIIRVYAIAQDVYLKWGADDVTASNFDEVIPAGQICDFLVPDNTTALNLIERVSGATVIVIEK